MKIWTHALAVLAGMSLTYTFFHFQNSPASSRSFPSQVDLRKADTEWPEVFVRLGIRSGDLITAVDGNPAPQDLLQRMMAGFQKGNVCVDYERDETARTTCFTVKGLREDLEERGPSKASGPSPSARSASREPVRRRVPYLDPRTGEIRGTVEAELPPAEGDIRQGDVLDRVEPLREDR